MSMSHDEMIAVLRAHKTGREIECSDRDNPIMWVPSNPYWNFRDYDYRIKPEPPKPREWWFVKSLGTDGNRYGWTRHDVQQTDVDYLEQIHVIEVLP